MKHILLLSALVAAAVADRNGDRLDQLLNAGNNQFTAKMFNEVVKINPHKSVILSAFSVMTPLAQLSLAAEGATHDELLRAIGLPNDDVTKAVFRHVKNLRALSHVDLKTASKIYVSDKSELNPQFKAITKEVFNSEAASVDFTKADQTAAEINSWVESKTNRRIKDLITAEQFGDDTVSVLVNAVNFKGKWAKPFNVRETKEEDFHVSKDKTIKVQMMYNKRILCRYTQSAELKAKILELPYSLTAFASFLVVLPNEVDGLDDLVEKLKDPAALQQATSQMTTYAVKLSLPKFKIETTTDLANVLKKMHVSKIFSKTEAQLTRLMKDEHRVYVSKAIQKVFIEVNEEGSEAAAANARKEKKEKRKDKILCSANFKADHPFVFLVKAKATILFNGVYNPKPQDSHC